VKMNNSLSAATAILAWVTAVLSGCSQKSGSVVRVVYPEVVGAPVIRTLRVKWGLDDLAREVLMPGEEITGVLDPKGGGGPMTVVLTIDGYQHSWRGRIGDYDDGQRYGVELRVDPLGGITEKHCRHPCPGSTPAAGEPWRTRLLSLTRAITRRLEN
jgi:hypothetical protein